MEKYQNEALSFEERARDMVEHMTVEECASQMLFEAAKVDHVGIQAYNWWNEALHGVARCGMATVFPQAIGMASSFDPELLHEVAEVISTEGRAKYNMYQKYEDYGIYKGITFWSPNVNIFRDPRWGRGQETYGEDPYLTGRLGVEFVKGLQGDDPRYLKAAACAKHFAVHSGPEKLRHEFNAEVSGQDLEETYLPAFKKLVDCGVEGFMATTTPPPLSRHGIPVDWEEKPWQSCSPANTAPLAACLSLSTTMKTACPPLPIIPWTGVPINSSEKTRCSPLALASLTPSLPIPI